MKHFLLLSFLFVFAITKITAQVELPQALIVPTGSLGEVSEIRKKILEKTLKSFLDDYFAIVPKDLFEEAEEKAFEELDYEECTEEQCIILIKEMLQVEHSFQLVLMAEGETTFLSLNWKDLDRERVEEDVCDNCDTIKLRQSIASLVKAIVIDFQKIDVVYFFLYLIGWLKSLYLVIPYFFPISKICCRILVSIFFLE